MAMRRSVAMVDRCERAGDAWIAPDVAFPPALSRVAVRRPAVRAML
jgi:hypothetical protein